MEKTLLALLLVFASSCLCQENPKHKDPFVSELFAQTDAECGEPEGDGLMFSCEHRSPAVVTVEAGQSLTLNCSVSGSRNPVVQWKKNGRTIAQGASRARRGAGRPFLRTEMLHHTIGCVTPKDAGVYTCIGHADDVTIRQKTAVFVVTDKSTGVGAKCTPSQPAKEAPKIYASTETIFDAPGATARLTCRATGFPVPSISWYKRQMDMTFSKVENKVGGHVILQNGDLVIPPLSLDPIHFAEYKCEAKNEAGEDSATAYIQVMPTETQEELTLLAPSRSEVPADAYEDMDLGVDDSDMLALKKRKRNRRQLFWQLADADTDTHEVSEADAELSRLSSRDVLSMLDRLEQVEAEQQQ